MSQKILIVEDSEDLSHMLRIALQKKGYDVHCSVNGYEALKYLFQTSPPPDLIILDLMMPVMDGYEFRRLQMQDPKVADVPVVVLTADGGFSGAADQMKVNAHLRKPANLNQILQVVHDQLDDWMEQKLG